MERVDKKVYLDTAGTQGPKFRWEPGPDEFTDVVIGSYPGDPGEIFHAVLVGSKEEMLAWADEFKAFVEKGPDG